MNSPAGSVGVAAAAVLGAVVPPLERDPLVIERDQAAVGDGHPMGAASTMLTTLDPVGRISDLDLDGATGLVLAREKDN
jgi:hypothetical protein